MAENEMNKGLSQVSIRLVQESPLLSDESINTPEQAVTLVIIVIAPTARSPPYLDKLEVKLIDKILSVDNMTNVDIPRARHGKMISFCSLKFSFLRCRIVFFPDKKRRIHIAPTA